MKWVIKNPTPMDSRLKKWGDYHFGRCLTKYLRRLGHEVETDYHPEWESNRKGDVVLVLRGKYPFGRPPGNKDSIYVMWNISHPSAVELEEYESYDLVLVASEPWAKKLSKKIKTPVYALLQCTDTEEFFPQDLNSGEARKDFVFVGNTRDVRRECIIWAIDFGLPLKVCGRGWSKWLARKYVVSQYVDNEELGKLYSRARATLNEHWPDMKKYGFINNRIFDALACGLPVISDYHEELIELFPREILYFRNRQEFESCIERMLFSYPEIEEGVQSAIQRVQKDFSFKQRAEVLSDLIGNI